MILFIKTYQSDKLEFRLLTADKVSKYSLQTDQLSEEFIPELDCFLLYYKVKLKDLEAVAFDVNETSFSKLRTIVAIVNALAYALKLKIIEVKIRQDVQYKSLIKRKGTDQIVPKYEKPPNITKPKRKT